MVLFLIKSTFCLALLFLFYMLVLQKAKIHQFNRFYLIGILLFSIFIPNYNLYVESSALLSFSEISNISVSSNFFTQNLNFFIGGYILISLVLFIRFLISLGVLFSKVYTNERIKKDDFSIVLLNEKVLPHTFFNYLFINKEDYIESKINEELFTHELTHINEKHSVDIILVELYQVIFWFNPLLVLVKQAIRLNHEFIADDKVVHVHSNAPKYQELLLTLVATNQLKSPLVSTINYSVTKKRFLMMTKTSSRFNRSILKFSLIPLIVLFVFLFANKVESQEVRGNEHSVEINENTHAKENRENHLREGAHNESKEEHN